MGDASYTLTQSDGDYYLSLHYPNGKQRITKLSDTVGEALE